jgi:biopolymer transport protein ExbD
LTDIRIAIAIVLLLTTACNVSEKKPEESKTVEVSLNMVDVRIFPDGQTFINGEQTNFSAMDGLVSPMPIDKKTRARFIFVEGEQTPLVYKTTRLLHQKGANQVLKIILERNAFDQYLDRVIHIDILNNGKILFNGKELYPDDLEFALGKKSVPGEKEVRITLFENSSDQTRKETLMILKELGFSSFSYSDLADFK